MDEEVAIEAMRDPKNKGKYHSVVVDFAGEGKEIITKEMFLGTKKVENAEIFIHNYEKTK